MKETFDYSKELDSKLRGKFGSLKKEISDNDFSKNVIHSLPVERTPLWQYAIYAAAFVFAIVLISSFKINFSLDSLNLLDYFNSLNLFVSLNDFFNEFTNTLISIAAYCLNAIHSIFTNIYFYMFSFVAIMLFALRYIRNFASS